MTPISARPLQPALFSALLALTGLANAQPVGFTVLQLAPERFGTGDSVGVVDLNSAGESVGSVSGKPYRWSPSGQGVPVAMDQVARINDLGVVVGHRFTGSARDPFDLLDRAAIALPSGRVEIITPNWLNRDSFPTSINNKGTVVGWGVRGEFYKATGFVANMETGWNNLERRADPRLKQFLLEDVNDRELAVGYAEYGGKWRAVYYTAEMGVRKLDPGLQVAHAVNAHDEIAGTGAGADGPQTGFIVRRGAPARFLPLLAGTDRCGAYDLNNHGVAVGYCWIDQQPSHGMAVAWYPSGGAHVVVELSKLVPPLGPDVEFTSAIAVNDRGQIAVNTRHVPTLSGGASILTPAD